jgi:hypothetical protein
MDTSPEYIKMCDEALEYIPQGEIDKLDDHTFWAQQHYGEWVVDARAPMPKDDTPLFRQDQLQEMVADGPDYHLYRFPLFTKTIPPGILKSMEQYWLAYVMKTEYGKVWNGDEWKNA